MKPRSKCRVGRVVVSHVQTAPSRNVWRTLTSRRRLIVVAVLVLSVITISANAQNVLVNGGFENNPPSTLGNHIGWSIAPWVLGTGQQSNVVTVDGGAGYGNLGPRLDADPATGPGVKQHYLDIANGSNDFYQSFTPQCSGDVDFGGFFSTRVNSPGTASVKIVQGVGTGGTVIGATNQINLPGGNSATDPWTPVGFTVPVTAGTTYSFVVQMDNNMNFDEGYVRYRVHCDVTPTPTPRATATATPRATATPTPRATATATPTPTATPTTINPCCPPWNTAAMADMLIPVFSGGATAPYTLHFVPTAAFNSQIQAYVDYLHTMNSSITLIGIDWELHDQGTGTTCTNCVPPYGPMVGPRVSTTWTQGGNGTPTFTNPGFFTGFPMLRGHCYMVHTRIYLNGRQKFFPDSCTNNDICVQWQVTPRPGRKSELEIRAGKEVIKRIPAEEAERE